MLQANINFDHVAPNWKHNYADCMCKWKVHVLRKIPFVVCERNHVGNHLTFYSNASFEQQTWQKNWGSMKKVGVLELHSMKFATTLQFVRLGGSSIKFLHFATNQILELFLIK